MPARALLHQHIESGETACDINELGCNLLHIILHKCQGIIHARTEAAEPRVHPGRSELRLLDEELRLRPRVIDPRVEGGESACDINGR